MGTGNTWYTTWYENTYIPSLYKVKYTKSTGETIYEQTYPIREPTKRRRQDPELEAGDTAALDEFLGAFGDAKE